MGSRVSGGRVFQAERTRLHIIMNFNFIRVSTSSLPMASSRDLFCFNFSDSRIDRIITVVKSAGSELQNILALPLTAHMTLGKVT